MVCTLTPTMAKSGAPDLPLPTPEAMAAVLKPAPTERMAYIKRYLQISMWLPARVLSPSTPERRPTDHLPYMSQKQSLLEQHAGGERPPSIALLARELLAFAELGAYYAAVPWWTIAPRGNGGPVLVLPGLAQSDFSTRLLRCFLKGRGHAAHGWGLGTNSGNTGLVDDHLLARLKTLHEKHGRKVSVVGWSMGGLLARNLACAAPDSVRQVITLGSPFTGNPKASNAWRLYEAMSGQQASDPNIAERFQGALRVPTTSIFSRRDGIVAWQWCLNKVGQHAENIEVVSSHFGMGHHPAVLYAIADRLAQPEGQWRAFKPTGAPRWMYPKRHADSSPLRSPRSGTGQLRGERA